MRGLATKCLLLVSLVAAGWPLPASAAGDESRLYVAGRRAVLDGRWNEAVLYLTSAIEKESQEGHNVVVYGKHREPYVPHFYLGVAFFELGALDAAFTAWRESERQGHLKNIDSRRHKTLADYLRRYGSRLAAARAVQQSELELQQLRELLGGVEVTAGPRLEAELRELHQEIDRGGDRLAAARRALEAPALEDSAPAAGTEGPDADALALLERVAALKERVEAFAETVDRAAFESVVRRLEEARCDAAAVDDLIELLERGGPGPGIGDETRHALLQVTGALDESCVRSRQVMLALSRGAPALDRLDAPLVERLQALTRGPEQAVEAPRDDSLELLAAGGCHRPAMARLTRWLERRALGDPPAEHEVVRRRLAEAHVACGEPELAAFYLGAEGAGTGVPEEPELPESPGPPESLEPPESPGLPESPAAGRQIADAPALAEAWAEATLRVDAGICDAGLTARLLAWSGWSDLVTETAGVLAGVPWDPSLYRAAAARNCDDREVVARFLGLARAADHAAAEAGSQAMLRDLEDWSRRRAAADFYTGRYALIFAAGDYGEGRRGWSDLPGARRDAEAVREALLRHGFDAADLVLDPRGRTVRREMERFIGRHGGERNLLLVYWAGHGAVLQGRYGGQTWSTGFLVPVDAPFPHPALDPSSDFVRQAVSMDSLDRWAREMKSRHALFMLDSCYSGTAFQVFGAAEPSPRRVRLGRGAADGVPWDPLARFRHPVRLFISSSAADQQAADSSELRRSFVDLLERPAVADYRRDQVVSGRELCLHLGESTREASGGRQSPRCQSLPSPWDRGDVVFPVTGPAAPESPVARWVRLRFLADLATRQAIAAGDTPEPWQEYLSLYPEGRFASLARQRLEASAGL